MMYHRIDDKLYEGGFSSKQTEVASHRIDAFLEAIEKVERVHNLSISHQDQHGGFIIEEFSESNLEWLKGASVDVPEEMLKITISKEEFRKRWEEKDGITFEDVLLCVVEWGLSAKLHNAQLTHIVDTVLEESRKA